MDAIAAVVFRAVPLRSSRLIAVSYGTPFLPRAVVEPVVQRTKTPPIVRLCATLYLTPWFLGDEEGIAESLPSLIVLSAVPLCIVLCSAPLD